MQDKEQLTNGRLVSVPPGCLGLVPTGWGGPRVRESQDLLEGFQLPAGLGATACPRAGGGGSCLGREKDIWALMAG